MSETPSDRARELLRGAFDTHMHISPDVVERIIDDISLARKFPELGMAGFVLKSHYGRPRNERRRARGGPGVQVLGAITLNRAVGGINPLAVEIAAREGARTVWLPTVDSRQRGRTSARRRPAPRCPSGSSSSSISASRGSRSRRCRWSTTHGSALPEMRAVLGMIARHEMVLATGPSQPRRDLRGRRRGASKRASDRSWSRTPSSRRRTCRSRISVRWRRAARCSSAASRPRTPARSAGSSWLENIRATGPEHSVLSTDLGQVFNPPVEDGMALMVDRLLDAGFDEEEIH